MNLNNIKLPVILRCMDIMYIEDEDNIRKNISNALQSITRDVSSFAKIDTALEYFNNSKPDIIITDITLEEESGLDLIKIIKQKDKNIPILILSAHNDINYLLEATSLKLVEYLIKPVSFAKLESALLSCVKDIIENGNLIIKFLNGTSYNVQSGILKKGEEEITLTASETTLLKLFIENIGENLPTNIIKNVVWSDIYDVSDSAFKSLLNKLRNKIGKESIKNRSTIGYTLVLN